jgi:hypothetical protein
MLWPALALIAGLGVTALVTVSGVVVVTLAAMRGTTAAAFRPSPGYLTANLVIVALGAAAGGFTTSRITAGRSLFTVLVLALIMLVSGVVPVLRGTPPQPGQPAWYPLVLALLTPACALIGGLLERRRAAG